MRNRWEEKTGDDLDAPAAISERQLRRLRGSARAGVLALLLALVATLASAWTLVMESDSLSGVDGIRSVRERVLGAIGEPATGELPKSPAAQPESVRVTEAAVAPDSTTATPGGTAPATAGSVSHASTTK